MEQIMGQIIGRGMNHLYKKGIIVAGILFFALIAGPAMAATIKTDKVVCRLLRILQGSFHLQNQNNSHLV